MDPTATEPIRFSMIIPIYNEARYLAQTLESIEAQTAAPASFEVLLYDGGSTDNTREIAAQWADRIRNFQLADNPGKLPSSGRNLGLRDSVGDVVAFIEGHCILPPDYVTRALELLDQHQVDALGRPVDLLVPSDPPVQQAIGVARMSPIGHARSSYLYSDMEGICSPISCATIYRRSAFDELGHFDEALYVAEDVDFNKRFEAAGNRHYFSQDIGCLYHPRRTFREFLQQMYNYGLGRTRSAISLGSVSLSDSAPVVLTLGVVISALAGCVWWPLWLPALAYFAGIVLFAGWLVLKRGRPLLWPLVCWALLVIHFGMAWGQYGGIWEWLCKKTPA